MNKTIILIIFLVLVGVGTYFGFNHFQNKKTNNTIVSTPQKTAQTKPELTPQTQPVKVIENFNEEVVLKEINTLLSKEDRLMENVKSLYNKNDVKIAIGIVNGKKGGSPAECIFSKKTGSWVEIGCHQNIIPCEMLDKAGMDRATTVELKCFNYDSQMYRK